LSFFAEMLIAVLSGFVLAALMPFVGKQIRNTLIPSLLPISLFAYFLTWIPVVSSGSPALLNYTWVSSLGVDIQFNVDGLSLLFSLLITGIGSLVFLYTSAYMKGHGYLERFYGYLSIFMGSMLGLVLSDNIITLFIFWELTSISSFFLIGFNNDERASRKSALTALAVTGAGGLFLLASFVLIGNIAGTYSFQSLLNDPQLLKGNTLYPLLAGLVFMGAFTKSAQFPFYFWLPAAMKAPTPVSTYLHSATMVKAGVYLLARFTPLLGDTSIWNDTLTIVGGFTMLFAAFHSIFKKDLKEILAFTTVAALGILVFLIGIGTSEALLAAGVFILVHALYKATLFLVTGIIDHETGTRNVEQLAGLRWVMMPVAIAGLLAALSNAGIPPFFGFIGKDLIYEGTLHSLAHSGLLTTVAVLTNIFLLYAGFQAGIRPFWGKLPLEYQEVHLPPFLLWSPPLLLATLGFIFGVSPFLINDSLIQPVLSSMIIGEAEVHLKLWHGFNTVLMLSGLTIFTGIGLYLLSGRINPLIPKMEALSKWSAEQAIMQGAFQFQQFSRVYSRILQNGYLKYYLLTIVGFTIILLSYRLIFGVNLYVNWSQITELTVYEVGMTIILVISVIVALFSKSRLISVAAVGGVGYAICIIFVFYSAPDLAMTQFTVDTLTLLMFVLVLSKLPPYLRYSNTKTRLRDGAVALSFGALISILAIEVLNEAPAKQLTEYYAMNSYLMAKGKNVVNVILVDFRGLDTMVEITVLSIAALGVYALLKLPSKTEKS
jgi:multicomponent Na+:H+ antiporter subunit A